MTVPKTCQTLKLKNSTIRISENFQNTIKKYCKVLELKRCQYKTLNKGVERPIEIDTLCNIFTQ
jgi:hypothetical protein